MLNHNTLTQSINYSINLTCDCRCRAKLIDGKAMAKEIRLEVKEDVEKWVAMGNRRPHLTAILVGADPASHTYVRNKMKAAKETGMFVIIESQDLCY